MLRGNPGWEKEEVCQLAKDNDEPKGKAWKKGIHSGFHLCIFIGVGFCINSHSALAVVRQYTTLDS